MRGMMKYTVWAGGVEVNDYLIDTLEEAQALSDYFWAQDYEDVKIESLITQAEEKGLWGKSN